MLLADMLAAKESFAPAFEEFQRVVDRFPGQSYSNYARIRYALALVGGKRPEAVSEVIAPVLADAAWAGRARYALGRANEEQGKAEAAIADYIGATQSADSAYIRGEAYLGLSRLYAAAKRFSDAGAALQACLNVSAYREDRLNLKLDLMRDLCEAGSWDQAAGLALDVTMEVQNEKWRYPEALIAHTVKECDAVLDRCAHALGGGRETRPAPAE